MAWSREQNWPRPVWPWPKRWNSPRPFGPRPVSMAPYRAIGIWRTCMQIAELVHGPAEVMEHPPPPNRPARAPAGWIACYVTAHQLSLSKHKPFEFSMGRLPHCYHNPWHRVVNGTTVYGTMDGAPPMAHPWRGLWRTCGAVHGTPMCGPWLRVAEPRVNGHWISCERHTS